MAQRGRELFVLYQIGVSEEFTWFSVVGVFLTESALREYAVAKGIPSRLEIREPTANNEVVLVEPVDYVAVRAVEGEVPDVELAA